MKYDNATGIDTLVIEFDNQTVEYLINMTVKNADHIEDTITDILRHYPTDALVYFKSDYKS